MFIYIHRHAWAGSFGDPAWPNDDERPLTSEGRERFARVVERLVERGFAPGAIATSPLIRCRQTAEIIAARAPGDPAITATDSLLPGSNLAALLQWSASQNGQDVCWIGHAPDVADLTAALVDYRSVEIRFPQGACAAVRMNAAQMETASSAGGGQLEWLATAETLGV